MAETTIRTVGIRPAAATPGTLYTCPTGKEAVVHVTWSNDETANTTIYVAVRASGAGLASTHYRVGPTYTIFSRDTGERRSITLKADDILEVLSASGLVTFQVSGIERDIAGAAVPTLLVREIDGSPSEQPVGIIEVSNGTLTIPVAGTARITTGGGAGGADQDAQIYGLLAILGFE